ncbi:MAG: hypothetical protein LKF53_04505 [Solobacterium sp.]|jgi:S-DNA-T family DNA segregation ATPase FtsK/SpoIIIE|nr:hypothetical protein [Solobacterium sp.]MCH4205635.1 hypothetical protein [Solobacterium sp.]MCH4282465.1 hypothetical protein [Solobacterium sp.]
MNVFIAEKSRIYELTLLGTYAEALICEKRVVFILVNHSWHIKLPHDLVYVSRDPIEDGGKITLKLKQKEEICELFFLSDGSSSYRKYEIKDIVHIGSHESDDIAFEDDIEIDTIHHCIHSESRFASLNGRRFRQISYQCGDVLLAKGLHLIFGPAFLMVRQKEEKTSLRLLEKKCNTGPIPVYSSAQRSIRSVPAFPASIELKAPKKILSPRQGSTLAMMFPSIMMMSAVLLIGIWNAYRAYEKGKDILDSLSSVLMPAVMLLSILCAYPLMNYQQKRKYKKEIKKRDQIYRMYLEQTVRDTMDRQREYYFALYQNHISLSCLLYCLSMHVFPEAQEDLRIGTRMCQLQTEVKKHFNAEEEDTLSDEIEQAEVKLNRSVHVPFLMPKMKIQIEGEDAEKLFLSLLIQAAVYGRNVFLISDLSFVSKYPFLQRLPGLMNAGGRNISSHFQGAENAVIFQTAVQDICEDSVYLNHVSENAQLILHAGKENWFCDAVHHEKDLFEPELYQGSFPDAPLACPLFFQYNDPSFLDMYHVNDAKDLYIPSRWSEHQDESSLHALIGCESSGAEIVLDLSEQGNGPHGLIAGTTGSGKSELILTMLLSLMVNYSPEQLQIAFIDFKGGSAAQAFEVSGKRLPHIVGCLSNLDMNGQDRVMYALKNECIARQKILQDAGRKYHCSIMNLMDYRRLKKKNMELSSLADLVIVVDEFAELKTQNYEMLNQLISIARIGRSLGIHLILSTQKPAGVVNEQIWSNSRFKICLKVAEKQDSMEVLHTSDAMELHRAGEFILACDQTMQKGIAGYSGYRRSLQNMQLQTMRLNGTVKDEYASYGEFADPEILSICREINRSSHHTGAFRRLWLEPISKYPAAILYPHHAIGIIDDYYHQVQPYCIFEFDAKTHWGFLAPQAKSRKHMISFLRNLFDNEFSSVRTVCAENLCKGNNSDEERTDRIQIVHTLQDPAEKKILIMSDPSRTYQKIGNEQMHDLLEHSEEYAIQFIFMMPSSSSVPYRDQNFIVKKICMQNESIEEMNAFMNIRMPGTVKEEDKGWIAEDHLLQICFGFEEAD